MQLTPNLINAETQSGSHGRCAPLLIVIVIVVKSGRKRGSYSFIQDRAPLGREVTVLIAIIIL